MPRVIKTNIKPLYRTLSNGESVVIFGKKWTYDKAVKDFILLKYSFNYINFKKWYKILMLEDKLDRSANYEQLTLFDL